MLILFACFLEKAPVGSLSLVAHGRHFTLQLSALLICFEWSWPCSKRACGFPHLWLFAVVSALSESPSVQEEPEQFSHSVFSPPLHFPWHSPGFHLQPMLFFKCTLKALYSPSFFTVDVKRRIVSILNLFSLLSLIPISFTSSRRSVVSRLLCSYQCPSNFQLFMHVRYASRCLGLITRRNFPREA